MVRQRHQAHFVIGCQLRKQESLGQNLIVQLLYFMMYLDANWENKTQTLGQNFLVCSCWIIAWRKEIFVPDEKRSLCILQATSLAHVDNNNITPHQRGNCEGKTQGEKQHFSSSAIILRKNWNQIFFSCVTKQSFQRIQSKRWKQNKNCILLRANSESTQSGKMLRHCLGKRSLMYTRKTAQKLHTACGFIAEPFKKSTFLLDSEVFSMKTLSHNHQVFCMFWIFSSEQVSPLSQNIHPWPDKGSVLVVKNFIGQIPHSLKAGQAQIYPVSV